MARKEQRSPRTTGMLISALLALLALECAAAAKPNILFILIDDMGWMDLGCQGNPHLKTPNIDRVCDGGNPVYGCLCAGARMLPDKGGAHDRAFPGAPAPHQSSTSSGSVYPAGVEAFTGGNERPSPA